MAKRRLRIFAGPNGSGKSTIKSVIAESLLGHYLNPYTVFCVFTDLQKRS